MARIFTGYTGNLREVGRCPERLIIVTTMADGFPGQAPSDPDIYTDTDSQPLMTAIE